MEWMKGMPQMAMIYYVQRTLTTPCPPSFSHLIPCFSMSPIDDVVPLPGFKRMRARLEQRPGTWTQSSSKHCDCSGDACPSCSCDSAGRSHATTIQQHTNDLDSSQLALHTAHTKSKHVNQDQPPRPKLEPKLVPTMPKPQADH